jgi:hypothetical protein
MGSCSCARRGADHRAQSATCDSFSVTVAPEYLRIKFVAPQNGACKMSKQGEAE